MPRLSLNVRRKCAPDDTLPPFAPRMDRRRRNLMLHDPEIGGMISRPAGGDGVLPDRQFFRILIEWRGGYFDDAGPI